MLTQENKDAIGRVEGLRTNLAIFYFTSLAIQEERRMGMFTSIGLSWKNILGDTSRKVRAFITRIALRTTTAYQISNLCSIGFTTES